MGDFVGGECRYESVRGRLGERWAYEMPLSGL